MDNLPKLRNISDIESQPLPSLVHEENSQVEASDEVSVSFPLSEPASVLDEVKRELSSLNGLFKKFLHHNLKIEKQVAPTCTVVRPDGDESEKLNMAENSFRKCKRSHDELSICQSHNSFEHNLVSHTQCYAEGTSSVANKLDVSSPKRFKAVDNSVDVDSLFSHGVTYCYGYGGKKCFRRAPVLFLYLLPSCFARRVKEVNLIG